MRAARRARVGGARDDAGVLLADVAATSTALAATRSRLAKRALLVDLLRRTDAADVEVVARYLGGRAAAAAHGAGLAVADRAARPRRPSRRSRWRRSTPRSSRWPGSRGPGRRPPAPPRPASLFAAATADEQQLLRGLVTGELRQGALDALLLDAVAEAVGRARRGRPPGRDAGGGDRAGGRGRARCGLLPRRLPRHSRGSASSSGGRSGRCSPRPPRTSPPRSRRSASGQVVVDTKLDGIRIQVHRRGDDVRVYTRSLDDITARVPEIVAIAARRSRHRPRARR